MSGDEFELDGLDLELADHPDPDEDARKRKSARRWVAGGAIALLLLLGIGAVVNSAGSPAKPRAFDRSKLSGDSPIEWRIEATANRARVFQVNQGDTSIDTDLVLWDGSTDFSTAGPALVAVVGSPFIDGSDFVIIVRGASQGLVDTLLDTIAKTWAAPVAVER